MLPAREEVEELSARWDRLEASHVFFSEDSTFSWLMKSLLCESRVTCVFILDGDLREASSRSSSSFIGMMCSRPERAALLWA